MDVLDIASIVFVCTAVNHLGMVEAIEAVMRRKLPVVGCVKCLTFWVVLGYGCYGIATYGTNIFTVLAISFLSAWSAIWLDLCMGLIDKLYLKIYGAIYSTADSSDTDARGAEDSVPDVPGAEGGERSCDNIATDGTERRSDNIATDGTGRRSDGIEANETNNH